MGMAVRDALLGALLTAAVSQLAFGVVNALSFLLAPALFARFPEKMGRVFPVAGVAFSRPPLLRPDGFPPAPSGGYCRRGAVPDQQRLPGRLLWQGGGEPSVALRGILAACLLYAACRLWYDSK